MYQTYDGHWIDLDDPYDENTGVTYSDGHMRLIDEGDGHWRTEDHAGSFLACSDDPTDAFLMGLLATGRALWDAPARLVDAFPGLTLNEAARRYDAWKDSKNNNTIKKP